MAYKTQKREEFLESLKNININPAPIDNVIEKFTPIGLSNLYKLFMDLVDVSLSDSQFNKLYNMVVLNYPKNISALLQNPITNNEINQLLEALKQEYLQTVYTNNPKNMSEKEQNALKIIVNKHYPELFLNFIENPITPKEFSEQQKFVKDANLDVVSTYYRQTTPHGQENLISLSEAIYLIYRKTIS